MIETKYGMKYTMPHSVVHIIDNSAHTGETPVVVAEDPSLYAAIVVTPTNIGEDNKVITITRSDVTNVAYGLGNITPSDITKFGQTITYANSLLNQDVPIRFMRVTPEGSTYAVSCIVVQWRVDPIDNKFHTRFIEVDVSTIDARLADFKNPEKLNAYLVKYFSKNNVDAVGYTWTQRVFMTYISAGRGKAYNYMATAINPVTQGKRPANIKYEFVTIDTRSNNICEQFVASLINDNSTDVINATDSVNVAVKKRVPGSSIIVPFVNEAAIREVYNAYMLHYDGILHSTTTDEFTKGVYNLLDVNTFDILYGEYVYEGSTGRALPFYQVDMLDTDIASLSESNRITTVVTDKAHTPLTTLYNELDTMTSGVTRSGDETYVGDIYLETVGTSNMNPRLVVVAGINQYTGSVTTVTIPKVYTLAADQTIDKSVSSRPIKVVFNDTTDAAGKNSASLNTLVLSGEITTNDIVAQVDGSSFKLYSVASVTPNDVNKYTLTEYSGTMVWAACDWNSHTNGASGVGNIIGLVEGDAAYTRVGSIIIKEDGTVYINDYTGTPVQITNCSKKFGAHVSSVNITTDIVGAQYDVLYYMNEDVDAWSVSRISIANGGTGYAVGDTVKVLIAANDGTVGEVAVKYTEYTTAKVTSVNSDGCVTGISLVDTKEYPKTATIDGSETTFDINTYMTVADGVYTPIEIQTEKLTDDVVGTGLTVYVTAVKINSENNAANPVNIDRYTITGSQGSLFRVAADITAIPTNYYSAEFGINFGSENGGVRLKLGSTGFFDEDLNPVEFKWRLSALLVKAYRGLIDPRIMSPSRVPAKYLYDGGTNTIIGQNILPYVTYTAEDLINASTIFTDDEKDSILFDPSTIANIKGTEDIDVKKAMYDLTVYRCYQGIPEARRPIGPGSGLSLHLDAGICNAETAMLVNKSFAKRFDNPNVSWDIGGWVDTATGVSFTYVKHIVDRLPSHCKQYTVNKPFTGKYSKITSDMYTSYFPDIDATDWDMRELMYTSGGNAWVEQNGEITRRSQCTLGRIDETSDLIQESNMRTLSQLVYLLQNKIDNYLLEYDDDGTLKTLSDECNNLFSGWIGTHVQSLTIEFTRDIDIDGGNIVICDVAVTFRGLILRVPIRVTVNRRSN